MLPLTVGLLWAPGVEEVAGMVKDAFWLSGPPDSDPLLPTVPSRMLECCSSAMGLLRPRFLNTIKHDFHAGRPSARVVL